MLTSAQIAQVIHASVPQGYRVKSSGFFLHQSPDVAKSPSFQRRPPKSAPDLPPPCEKCGGNGLVGAQPVNYCFDEIRLLLASGKATVCYCESGTMCACLPTMITLTTG